MCVVFSWPPADGSRELRLSNRMQVAANMKDWRDTDKFGFQVRVSGLRLGLANKGSGFKPGFKDSNLV